jgi:hypothetical protein
MTNHPKLTQCTDSAAHGISTKKATGSRLGFWIMFLLCPLAAIVADIHESDYERRGHEPW